MAKRRFLCVIVSFLFYLDESGFRVVLWFEICKIFDLSFCHWEGNINNNNSMEGNISHKIHSEVSLESLSSKREGSLRHSLITHKCSKAYFKPSSKVLYLLEGSLFAIRMLLFCIQDTYTSISWMGQRGLVCFRSAYFQPFRNKTNKKHTEHWATTNENNGKSSITSSFWLFSFSFVFFSFVLFIAQIYNLIDW